MDPLVGISQQGYIFGTLEDAQHRFKEQSLKKNKRYPNVLKECRVQILSEVLHVKSLSPFVKDDVL